MSDHGTFHWNELNTRDTEKAKRFYADTLGWTFDGMPMGNTTYWVAKAGDKMVGGIFDMNAMDMPKEIPEHWMSLHFRRRRRQARRQSKESGRFDHPRAVRRA